MYRIFCLLILARSFRRLSHGIESLKGLDGCASFFFRFSYVWLWAKGLKRLDVSAAYFFELSHVWFWADGLKRLDDGVTYFFELSHVWLWADGLKRLDDCAVTSSTFPLFGFGWTA